MFAEGKVYLGSFHPGTNPHPHWADFSFQPVPGEVSTRTLEHRIGTALYVGGHSVLPVMAERPYDRFAIHLASYFSPEAVELATARANASFLVIINDTEKYIRQAEAEGDRYKIDQIMPEDLLCIVMPQEIKEEYERTKEGKMSARVPIETVEYVERKLGFVDNAPLIIVPNYEEVIVKMSKDLGRPIEISGVRLPVCQRDLDFLKRGREQLQKMRSR